MSRDGEGGGQKSTPNKRSKPSTPEKGSEGGGSTKGSEDGEGIKVKSEPATAANGSTTTQPPETQQPGETEPAEMEPAETQLGGNRKFIVLYDSDDDLV